MSKISEQKALEEYPKETYYDRDVCDYVDVNASYIKGYNQAVKKACYWLSKQSMPKPVFWYLAMPKSLDWKIEDFKNYMQRSLYINKEEKTEM